MIKLTTKNYENLPEIRKKKEQESKKEELRKRLESAKELEKKRRQSQLNKRATVKAVSQQKNYKIEEIELSAKKQ